MAYFVTEDGRQFRCVEFVTIDGKPYVDISEDYYQYLQDEWERSRKVRYKGVEEFRLWCQANKGTSTVEEGLRACTPGELESAVSKLYNGVGSDIWTDSMNALHELRMRVEIRMALAQQARNAVTPTPIMPEEDEDNADNP